jgi:hypothetical protein
VAVADVNNDGKLELVAADARGNVAAFTAGGQEVWETHLGSQVHQAAVFGDVDGDGELEAVLATFRRVWVEHLREGGEDPDGGLLGKQGWSVGGRCGLYVWKPGGAKR